MRILFKIICLILLLVCIWILFNFSLFLYGIDQLKGQLHIVLNSRPINEMVADKNIPDSVKQKLFFIEKIKRFAIDSLGLKTSENYITFYDQGNKPLLWVLSASDPFKIKPYLWQFPLLGSVSYKGFFIYQDGKDEELDLIDEGFDTDYNEVSAWSTLGWFHDPVLSNMIYRSKGQLAELIIHELTHSTLYLKSNVDLNENLASVCGEQGAIRFLIHEYGDNSTELSEYLNRKSDYDLFSNKMLLGTHRLDSLYKVMTDSTTLRKISAKNKMINEIVHSIDSLPFHSARYKSVFKDHRPNNAFFIDFIRYDAQKDEMKKDLTVKFNGNIKLYIDYLRTKYS